MGCSAPHLYYLLFRCSSGLYRRPQNNVKSWKIQYSLCKGCSVDRQAAKTGKQSVLRVADSSPKYQAHACLHTCMPGCLHACVHVCVPGAFTDSVSSPAESRRGTTEAGRGRTASGCWLQWKSTRLSAFMPALSCLPFLSILSSFPSHFRYRSQLRVSLLHLNGSHYRAAKESANTD